MKFIYKRQSVTLKNLQLLIIAIPCHKSYSTGDMGRYTSNDNVYIVLAEGPEMVCMR